MYRCRPKNRDTHEHGYMLETILKLEGGEVTDRDAKVWSIEGEKRREPDRLREEFKDDGFMSQQRAVQHYQFENVVGQKDVAQSQGAHGHV